jgi:hypothetical protein
MACSDVSAARMRASTPRAEYLGRDQEVAEGSGWVVVDADALAILGCEAEVRTGLAHLGRGVDPLLSARFVPRR